MSHPAELDEPTLLRDCEITRTRRSGPGGQHRNKVETAIVIVHTSSGIRAEASERRSQEENRKMAVWRLRIQLAIQIRTKRAGGRSPSALWLSRTKGGRVQVSDSHDDFPALLAEALDVVADHQFDLPTAANRLTCSTSQLVKLLQKEPQAMSLVNRQRGERGMRPLK